jgi:hypothetical protein
MSRCWHKPRNKRAFKQDNAIIAHIYFYLEDHEGHEVKNKKIFSIIFMVLRVLRGEWKNLTLVGG